MSRDEKTFGLSAAAKASLIARFAERSPHSRKNDIKRATTRSLPSDDIDKLGPYREMQVVRSAGELLGIENPFFRVHDGKAGAETSIGGRRFINFSSYDYLGLNGHPRVAAAAKAAIDRYGTSVSASRLVSGERAIHRDLEHGLAETLGTEDCVVLVSGHATFVTVVGHLLSRNDLILHDALIHNSILCGAMLSGAQRVSFPHNDVEAAGRILAQHRARSAHALIAIEGLYSMDGDVPDLPAFVELAERHNAWILVDEAHSLGVLGRRGFGIAEHFGVDPECVDLWMGTLSKTLASAGGYVAGRKKLIEYLKYSAPGFVYSVGMPPPVAAAAHAALEVLAEEPERVRRLNANARLFLKSAKAEKFDTGTSDGYAIVPLVTGSSVLAGRLSDALFRRGVNVQPILYPAVAERAARLRFFLSASHTEEQIRTALAIAAEESARLREEKVDLQALAQRLASSNSTT